MSTVSSLCGAHAGECVLCTTSEGTCCTLSGIEVSGPQLVCYNFESAGNRVFRQATAQTRQRRSEQSLAIKSRAMKSITTWKDCVLRLYPTLPPGYAHSLATALCDWSTQLNLCKGTHPAIKRWPMLFAATVTSHMATGGVYDRSGQCVVPNSAHLAALALEHKEYKKFGITCRSMSIAWRQLRAAVLDSSGMLISANAFTFSI